MIDCRTVCVLLVVWNEVWLGLCVCDRLSIDYGPGLSMWWLTHTLVVSLRLSYCWWKYASVWNWTSVEFSRNANAIWSLGWQVRVFAYGCPITAIGRAAGPAIGCIIAWDSVQARLRHVCNPTLNGWGRSIVLRTLTSSREKLRKRVHIAVLTPESAVFGECGLEEELEEVLKLSKLLRQNFLPEPSSRRFCWPIRCVSIDAWSMRGE